MSDQPTLASALASVTDLMELIDEYADARHRCGDGSYNTTTAAARKAVVVALSAQAIARDERAAAEGHAQEYASPPGPQAASA